MSIVAANSSARGGFDGVLQVVRYNWPQYAAGAVVISGAMAWWAQPVRHHGVLWFAVVAAALLAIWWCAASLLVSHWIYDRSALYRWSWIPAALGAFPRRWLNLHAGLDESSAALRTLFPGSFGRTCDFYCPAEMSEPSIQRARARKETRGPVERVNYAQLPFPEKTFEAVFVFFAAHELRRAGSREAFFRELRRVVIPRGAILLVEHARDLANFAAFGPGFVHFQSRAEWERLARFAGLEVGATSRMTPFVSIMLLRRPS